MRATGKATSAPASSAAHPRGKRFVTQRVPVGSGDDAADAADDAGDVDMGRADLSPAANAATVRRKMAADRALIKQLEVELATIADTTALGDGGSSGGGGLYAEPRTPGELRVSAGRTADGATRTGKAVAATTRATAAAGAAGSAPSTPVGRFPPHSFVDAYDDQPASQSSQPLVNISMSSRSRKSLENVLRTPEAAERREERKKSRQIGSATRYATLRRLKTIACVVSCGKRRSDCSVSVRV